MAMSIEDGALADKGPSPIVETLAKYFMDSVLCAIELEPKLKTTYKDTNGYKVLTDYLSQRTSAGLPIQMVLPAFPSKSCNKEKVLTDTPDFCEYTALLKLVSICQGISEIYEPGAKLWLFSDYHTFEKYISVSYTTHYKYRERLEMLVDELSGKDYINIVSLKDFPEFQGQPEENYQEILRETFGSREFEKMIYDDKLFGERMKESQDGDKEFARNFKGLRAFMLQDQFQILQSQGLNKKEIKDKSNELAAGMMVMGKALTPFIQKYFPNEEFFRLSIHAHPFAGKKFTIALLPMQIRSKKNMDSMSLGLGQPWHAAACYLAGEGKFLFQQSADLRKGFDVTYKVPESLKETFREIFDLLDTDGNHVMDLDEIQEAVLERGDAPSHALYEDIVRTKIAEVLGEEPLSFDAFIECLKKPEAVRLFSELLPAQLSRKHHLNPQQQSKFRHAFAKLKAQSSDSVLVTATYQEKPWMYLRFSVDSTAGESKHRLSNIKASFIKPGFGLLLEAGKSGLKREDFLSGDLDNLRAEFGCVVLRGLETPFRDKTDMLKMAKEFGFPIPWNFGPIHVVKPHADPKSDVESMNRLTYHFDMCYPPPYMGIDQQNTPYIDYIPGNFWLYCRHAPPEGEGETTVCDTNAVFRSLNAPLRRQFREVEICYINKNLSGEQYYGGADYVYKLVMDDPERPGREIIRFNELDPKTGKFLKFKRKPNDLEITEADLHNLLYSKFSDKKYTIYHSYKKDDLVFVNNHLTVHGRTEFTAPDFPRELWRIQIIPKPGTLPPFWEGSILADAIQEHLENSFPDPKWALKLLQQCTEKGYAVHYNAVCAIFKYMERSNDYAFWDDVSNILLQQRTPLDDDLAKALIDAQLKLPPRVQLPFAKWCESLLKSTDDLQLKNVHSLWVSTLRAGSHANDMQKYLAELLPYKNEHIPKDNSTMAASIDLYAKIGDIEGIQHCFDAVPPEYRKSELDRSYVTAMASNGRIDLALKAAEMVGNQVKSKARQSLFVGGKPSERVVDIFSVVLDHAIAKKETTTIQDTLVSVESSRIPLKPHVISKMVAFGTTTGDMFILRAAQAQLSHNLRATIPVASMDLLSVVNLVSEALGSPRDSMAANVRNSDFGLWPRESSARSLRESDFGRVIAEEDGEDEEDDDDEGGGDGKSKGITDTRGNNIREEAASKMSSMQVSGVATIEATEEIVKKLDHVSVEESPDQEGESCFETRLETPKSSLD